MPSAELEIDWDVVMEERCFFQDHFRMTDPEIAAKLKISWDTYYNQFRRHPEYGPLVDPDEAIRKHWAEFQSGLKRGRRNARI